MKEHTYIPRRAKILERKPLCDDVVSLKIKITDRKPFNFHPGQFVMLSVLGFGEVPIGITTSPKEKGYFEVAVRSIGMVTEKICSLSVGDYIGINGPFGNGFALDKIKDKNLVIISGGLGLAPLRSLIHHIQKNTKLVKSLTIMNGSKCPEQLLYEDEYKAWEKFAEVQNTVDSCGSEWTGCVGNITKLFDRVDIKRGSVIVSCGPPVMFPSIAKRYAGKTVSDKDMYFLLERKMKCGIGKCQHCTCGKLYVCTDGPVFSYYQLKYNDEAFK